MRIGFRFRWIPFIAMLVVVLIGVELGQWQTRRAVQKQAIQDTLARRQAAPFVTLTAAPVAPEEIEYRRVRVSGEFVRDWPLYLDNRPYQSQAGVYVLMPFKIAGSDVMVLVARGWAPRNAVDRARLPDYPTPRGQIEIDAVARRNPGRLLQLGAQQIKPGALLQNLEIAEFTAASKFTLQPFLLEQSGFAAAGPDQDQLVRDWPLPSSGIDKHRGYALQWYGLALTALLFFVITGFRRGTS
jgi:cytochrome oxidase assembly protein ShyY1